MNETEWISEAEPRFGGCVLIVLTLTAIVLVVLLLAVAQ